MVAWVAHTFIAGLPWAAAFALGAIVSPPDAVAAEAILKRLGVPARIRAVLGGESLVNDATALVAYQFAVAAMVTGQFSLGEASLRFLFVGLGGVGLGLLVGLVMRWVQGRLDDPPVQITISLLTPFAAYLLAERLHVSGVLAVVAAGMYLGLAFDRAFRAHPAPGASLLGNGRLLPQRFHLHHDRPAIARHPAQLEP